MSLPFIPLSQKVHLLGHDSTAEGDILGQGSAPARSRTPQDRFPPARLLHPGGRCGTGDLIPIRLEECRIPQRLSRWQWVDLFEADGYDKLMRSLRARAAAVRAASAV